MTKGQVIAGDFMISIAVFIVILMILLPAWYYVSTQTKSMQDSKNIELLTLSLSAVLTKTEGYPNNWTTETVKTVGFADKERNMNLTKVLEFKKINYATAKKLFGIGNYNFYLSFHDNGYNLTGGIIRSPVAYFANNELEIKDMIDNSGAVWDFYKAGASTSYGDARYFYNNADKVAAFNAMVDNQTQYMTIIIEDPELRGDEFGLEIDKLKEFVRTGGILIYKGQGWNNGIILDEFSMSSFQGPQQDGVLKNKSIAINATLGENITFSNSGWSFYNDTGDNKINIIVAEKNVNSRCLLCQWKYGYGNVYYVADSSGTIQNGALIRSLNGNLNIIGERLVFGIEPDEKASYVMKIQRLIALDNNGLMVVKMDMVLWL